MQNNQLKDESAMVSSSTVFNRNLTIILHSTLETHLDIYYSIGLLLLWHNVFTIVLNNKITTQISVNISLDYPISLQKEWVFSCTGLQKSIWKTNNQLVFALCLSFSTIFDFQLFSLRFVVFSCYLWLFCFFISQKSIAFD